jgi:uncharacterized protein (TIGR00255 family)
MLKSMTGYGSSQYHDNEIFMEAEVKSINSKSLDIVLTIPQEFGKYENELKKMIASKLLRGKIIVSLKQQVASVDISSNSMDEEAFKQNFSLLKRLAKEINCSDDILFSAAMKMPGVIAQKLIKKDLTKRIEIVSSLIEEALKECDFSRAKEGAILSPKIAGYIDNVYSFTKEIDAFDKNRIDEIKKKLKERLALLKPISELSEGRLEQELAYYAYKIDIEEEKQRILSHIQQFKTNLAEGGAVSKKLLFIIQEINREANTIASKANNYQIQKLSIDIKEELEKIKEQLHNVL